MTLQKARIEVRRPATAEQEEQERAILAEIAKVTVRGESLRQQATLDLPQDAGDGGTPAPAGGLEEQMAEIEAEIERLGKQFEKKVNERVVALVVTEANRERRFEQQALMQEVDDWYRQQFVEAWRKANPELAEDPERPTQEDMREASLSVPRRVIQKYISLIQYCSLAATLVEEECENFTAPTTIYEWSEVPDILVEPAIGAAYRLNPHWRPDWTLEPEDADLKNASEPS